MGSGSRGRLTQLECLRGFAAGYVLAGHFANIVLRNPWWAFPLRFSQEAVMLFFLLSGFVIHYSTFSGHRQLVARDYFVKRVRRIYPLFLLAMGVGYLGTSGAQGAWQPLAPKMLLGNLAMLQDFGYEKPGVWVPSYYNGPLWSLAYEWWFYILFYIVHRAVPGASLQKYVVAAASLVALGVYVWVPNQPSFFVMYLIIWWAGTELAREYCQTGGVTFRGQAPMLGLLALSSVVWAAVLVRPQDLHRSWGLYPLVECRHVTSAWMLLLVGLAWRKARWVGFKAIFGVFAYLAPVTYGVYVFHFPIMDCLMNYVNPWLTLAITLAVVLPVAYLAEVVLQRVINRWTAPLLGRPPKAAPVRELAEVGAR